MIINYLYTNGDNSEKTLLWLWWWTFLNCGMSEADWLPSLRQGLGFPLSGVDTGLLSIVFLCAEIRLSWCITYKKWLSYKSILSNATFWNLEKYELSSIEQFSVTCRKKSKSSFDPTLFAYRKPPCFRLFRNICNTCLFMNEISWFLLDKFRSLLFRLN